MSAQGGRPGQREGGFLLLGGEGQWAATNSTRLVPTGVSQGAHYMSSTNKYFDMGTKALAADASEGALAELERRADKGSSRAKKALVCLKGNAKPAEIRIGLFSDTHDQIELIDEATKTFTDECCSTVVHCGDFDSRHSLERIAAGLEDTPLRWVAGNHDDWAEDSGAPGEQLSANGSEYGEFAFAGLQFGVAHGTYGNSTAWSQRKLREWAADRRHAYLFYGHFHQFNIKFPTRASSSVVIDPGGFYRRRITRRAKPRTMVVLNLTRRSVHPFVWSDQNGFEAIGEIGLMTRSIARGPGWETWVKEAACWAAEAKQWASEGKVLCGNWATASKHICSESNAWLSHDALFAGKESV